MIFYLSDTFACGHVRGIAPAAAINRLRCGVNVQVKSDMVYSDFDGADVMVFQRAHSPSMLNWMKLAKDRGIACVYELDDDLFSIPKEFPIVHSMGCRPHEFYERPEIRQTIQAFLSKADAIIVSTPELSDALSNYCQVLPRRFVIPNAIDLPMWTDAWRLRLQLGLTMAAQRESPLTIGWHASGSHNIDAPLVATALARVLEEHNRIQLHLVGWSGCFDTMHVLEPFKSRVFEGNWERIDRLPDRLASFDIGLACISDCAFNRAKSGIKYLELAAVGVPCIASPLPCYTRLIKDRVDGLLVKGNDPAGWYAALTELISSESLRWTLGLNARANVEDHWSCELFARTWVNVYRTIHDTCEKRRSAV